MRIPFEGKEIIGYLRLPKNANGPVPLVLAVNGLDSRKEDLTESFSAILPFGVGYLAVDGPGTGQNPIKVSENAERVLSRVLDYIATRPEIDKNECRDARRKLGRVLGDEDGHRRACPLARERARSRRRPIGSSRKNF